MHRRRDRMSLTLFRVTHMRPLAIAFVTALTTLLTLGCEASLVTSYEDAGRGSVPCTDPITVMPSMATVAPNGVLVLRASGGTGEPIFALAGASPTGARIDERSGVFVAGPRMGTDEVVVRDRRCTDEARATVTTTDTFAVVPSRVELAPGASITFTTRGGSGSSTFALVRTSSGATLTPAGRYTAGTMEGEDVLRATDETTGATADAVVRVAADAALRPVHELVVIPEDARHTARIAGGSAELDLVSSAPASVTVEGMRLLGASPGRADIAVTDRFTAGTTSFLARTAQRLEATSTYVGDRSDQTRILAHDVDGDGAVDAIVAMPLSSLGPVRGGAVLIYAGQAGGGLSETPARVLVGEARDDNFGQSVAVGDLDGDDVAELLVGAWQADNTGSNAGAVYVYPGRTGGFFADTPSQILVGVVSNDRFGVALGVCDLDGDGWNDVIVGAADSEDRDRTPRLSNQGSIFVHANVGGRVLSSPTQTIHGEVFPATGEPTAHNELRFGSWIATGDFDGDDLCDVAVYSARPDPAVSDDGAVSVLRGRAATMERRGGLEERPMLYVAAPGADGARSSRLGRALAMGDLDGDGRDELAIGQPLFDSVDAMMRPQDQTGAVRVFRGRTAGAGVEVRRPDEADLSITSDAANLQIGYAVAIADATGDGRPDLVSGDARLAAMGSMITRPGVVRVYAGVAGALPSATPTRAIEGREAESRFGWALAPLAGPGGRGERIVVYAGLADDGAHDAGMLFVTDATGALTELALPRQRGGRRLGQALAAMDLDDDGLVDLAVGAPLEAFVGTSSAGSELRGVQLGAVHVYRGTASGWPTSPSFTLRGFPGHSESDQLGDVLHAAGDYDGDGAADLVAVARLEDRSTAQAMPYALEAGCDFTTTVSDVGAALLFRGGSAVSGTSAPSMAIFGPEASRPITSVASLDFDGDGARDLALGGSGWSSGGVRGGGVWIVAHRDVSGAMPVGVCAPDHAVYGLRENDDLGAAMVALGDLDGDGCDDLAVGAPRAERRAMAPTSLSDEGMVAIVFGAGAACASARPVVAWLASGHASSSAGSALAAGDLDGDGRSELVVGARTFRNGLGEIGRVFVFDGDRLAALRAGAMASPDAGVTVDAAVSIDAGPPAPLDGGVAGGAFSAAGAAVLEGTAPGERLGASVAITRWRGMPAIAMGAPWADVGGRPDTGGVRFARWSAGTLTPLPVAVAGEDDEEGTELGASLTAFTQRGAPFLLVGAPWSNVGGVRTPTMPPPYAHEGAAYVVDLGD
ncbi:MAG: hypothetical protein OHK0013_40770 [Sandaracinaceae bacterium]